ncbi:MAG TPA: hypothetical protein PLR28_10240, partial [Dokdonella sp.]|nr:hypothetical protein [Dokdonella sp.]
PAATPESATDFFGLKGTTGSLIAAPYLSMSAALGSRSRVVGSGALQALTRSSLNARHVATVATAGIVFSR